MRKIGAPGIPEFAIGAIAEGGVRVLDHESVGALLISHEELEHAITRARAEVEARVERYRAATPEVPMQGRTVVVVDDGLATGATTQAAVRAAWARGPQRVVLAVPVSSRQAVELLTPEVDEVVCVEVRGGMWAVGFWYEAFGRTSDHEVIELLRRAGAASADSSRQPPGADPPVRRSASVELAGGRALQGDLVVPESATGLVIFAHGSGSSRHSPRNRHVAEILNAGGLATLLIDLLTPGEERDRRNVFDVELLSRRLVATTGWTREQAELAALPVGYFGASTGAAAALWAAADARDRVRAVVSRGGRPDLAAPRLHEVRARRHPPVRGTGRARRGRPARRRLVHPPPPAAGNAMATARTVWSSGSAPSSRPRTCAFADSPERVRLEQQLAVVRVERVDPASQRDDRVGRVAQRHVLPLGADLEPTNLGEQLLAGSRPGVGDAGRILRWRPCRGRCTSRSCHPWTALAGGGVRAALRSGAHVPQATGRAVAVRLVRPCRSRGSRAQT